MTVFQAFGLLIVSTTASAILGLVTGRLTAYWLKFARGDISFATTLGAAFGLLLSSCFWLPIADDYYRIEAGMV